MKKTNLYITQDRIVMRIAACYGMTYEYKTVRPNEFEPLEAMEDWDFIIPMKEPCSLSPQMLQPLRKAVIAGITHNIKRRIVLSKN